MSISKCKHGIYLDGCRECYPLPDSIYDMDFWEKDMTLLEEAKKLADDIREYAPDTNIEVMIRDLIKEIEALKEVNAKQLDYIAEQKTAYANLWKEHMELFWKHEQDKDLTNE